MNFVDQINLNGNVATLKGVDADRYYPGTDLTLKHADEIADYTDPWAWIKARIVAQNLSQIHVGDYIPFTCTNNVVVKAQVAGIDTYYRYGDSAVPHHIDFISRELWPTTFKMNLVNFNNGVSETVKSPWLGSNGYAFLNSLAMDVPNSTSLPLVMESVDYTAGGVFSFLPAALKAVIVEKRLLLPTRYSASGVLSSDNSWEWKNAGKLWLPSEMEITGSPIFGGGGVSAGGFVQYPIFAQNMNRLKNLGVSGGRYSWWSLSAPSGNTSSFVYIYYNGSVDNSAASSAYGGPVCFRISA